MVRRTILGALLLALVPVASASAALPTAQSFRGISQVGVLLLPNGTHYCSASVVSSRHRDLLLTAAHCVTGTGLGIRFAPGYRNGRAPYGVWSVTKMYVDPGWVRGQDPHRDYAFLRVAALRGRALQPTVGSIDLGRTPPRGRRVTVIGYPVGSGNAVRCTVPLRYSDGFPRIDCHGFVGGTSGGPFLHTGSAGHRWLVGLIGGLHQGGCTEATSYSPYFGPAIAALRDRADDDGPGDVVPPAGPSGC